MKQNRTKKKKKEKEKNGEKKRKKKKRETKKKSKERPKRTKPISTQPCELHFLKSLATLRRSATFVLDDMPCESP